MQSYNIENSSNHIRNENSHIDLQNPINTESSLEIKNNRKNESPVWEYFNKLPDGSVKCCCGNKKHAKFQILILRQVFFEGT
jgi:hypothetical protein